MSQIDTSGVEEDRYGRSRLLSNVVWGWGSYLFIFIIGFIMPRLIDRRIGQINLGIWDFGWSLVSYLSFSNLGIGSSVNRYVAKYRAVNDINGLRKAVSSVAVFQIAVSIFVTIATVAITFLLPFYFSNKLKTNINDAQWVVLLLGLSIAIEQGFNPFRGVISGCHRWDLHNALNVFSRIVAFVGMVGVLLLGLGLRELSFAYMAATLVTEIIRMIYAYRVCPGLKLHISYVRWEQAKEMILFGWKTVIATLSPLIIIQTTNVLVVNFLGPATLAILSRSVNLTRRVETLTNRFSFVTTPIAGAMQAGNRSDDIKVFLIESIRYMIAFVLPLILILIFFGDLILTVWMGPKYANSWVLAILAIGYFIQISQSPALRILVGMNLHGRVGVISLATVLVLYFLGILVVGKVGWSLISTSLLISIPLMVGNGVVIFFASCYYFKIQLFEYFRETFLIPILCSLPMMGIFLFTRLSLTQNTVLRLMVGGVGVMITFILYWIFIVPPSFRERAGKFVFKHFYQFGQYR